MRNDGSLDITNFIAKMIYFTIMISYRPNFSGVLPYISILHVVKCCIGNVTIGRYLALITSVGAVHMCPVVGSASALLIPSTSSLEASSPAIESSASSASSAIALEVAILGL